MKWHALVVDDDPEIQDDVRDRLESMGHSCDCVGCQNEAREHLATERYSYVLLDLEIPVRYGRKPRIANGQNLLAEIRETKGLESLPVIVMTAHGLDGPDLAVEVLRDGQASDFVPKPFPSSGETLERRIARALKRAGRDRPGAAAQPRSPATSNEEPQPFETGEMAFSKTRVELCGVKVCGGAGSRLIREILDVLRNKTKQGQHKPYSGDELAEFVDCPGGQNGVAGAIRDFRDKVANLLLTEANIQCDRDQDFIVNDRRYGYRLSPKIVVRDANDPQSSKNDPVNVPLNDLDHQTDVPVNDPDRAGLNQRQLWIMQQAQTGVELKVGHIQTQFECSKKTAKRDLTALRERGLIVFEGAPRTGFWRKPTENQATAR